MALVAPSPRHRFAGCTTSSLRRGVITLARLPVTFRLLTVPDVEPS